MRQLERSVQRDLDRIADRAPVSSASWERLRRRIAERAPVFAESRAQLRRRIADRAPAFPSRARSSPFPERAGARRTLDHF